jgi:hypothetical protein
MAAAPPAALHLAVVRRLFACSLGGRTGGAIQRGQPGRRRPVPRACRGVKRGGLGQVRSTAAFPLMLPRREQELMKCNDNDGRLGDDAVLYVTARAGSRGPVIASANFAKVS